MENRLRSYGHVQRRPMKAPVRIVDNIVKRGRYMHEDQKEYGKIL